jgi:hypothetical protein
MAIEQTDVARLKAVGAELGRIAAERKALIPERDELIRSLRAQGRSERFIAQVAQVSSSLVHVITKQRA